MATSLNSYLSIADNIVFVYIYIYIYIYIERERERERETNPDPAKILAKPIFRHSIVLPKARNQLVFQKGKTFLLNVDFLETYTLTQLVF